MSFARPEEWFKVFHDVLLCSEARGAWVTECVEQTLLFASQTARDRRNLTRSCPLIGRIKDQYVHLSKAVSGDVRQARSVCSHRSSKESKLRDALLWPLATRHVPNLARPLRTRLEEAAPCWMKTPDKGLRDSFSKRSKYPLS